MGLFTGLFTSKIGIGVLAGGFTLGGAGLLFNGTDTLDNASAFVKDSGERLTQFAENEKSLKSKIGLIKEDANGKISSANVAIADLEEQVIGLNADIEGLNADIEGLNADIVGLQDEITDLKASLLKEKGDHAATRALLATKTQEYNDKVKEVASKNAQITGLNLANQALGYALAKAGEEALNAVGEAVEADKFVAELEGELDKANEAVEAHGAVVDAVKEATKDAQPSTQTEIDEIDITLDEVVIGSDSN